MTDEELIEAIAKAFCCRIIENRPCRATHCPAMQRYGEEARAALAVAKREIIERCAKEAENECWDAEAHPESIYGSTCLKIAARIRSLADE